MTAVPSGGDVTARLAAIEAAPYAPEALRERVARAIYAADHERVGWRWEDAHPHTKVEYRRGADAAIAVVCGADGGAE